MADVATAVRGVLVAASIDDTATGGIYPDVLPQGCSFPAIRYQLIDVESYGHLTGKSGMAAATITVDCYALTRLASTSLEDAVRIVLDRYIGTVSSVQIVRVYIGVGRHLLREPEDNSDLGVYRASRDYRVWYVEATS